MSNKLFDRLTGEQDDPVTYPNIALHQFFSCMAEYGRGALTAAAIHTQYGMVAPDSDYNALVSLIDAEGTVNAKILKVQEVKDVMYIHENEQSNALYPDKAAVKARFGFGA